MSCSLQVVSARRGAERFQMFFERGLSPGLVLSADMDSRSRQVTFNSKKARRDEQESSFLCVVTKGLGRTGKTICLSSSAVHCRRLFPPRPRAEPAKASARTTTTHLVAPWVRRRPGGAVVQAQPPRLKKCEAIRDLPRRVRIAVAPPDWPKEIPAGEREKAKEEERVNRYAEVATVFV